MEPKGSRAVARAPTRRKGAVATYDLHRLRLPRELKHRGTLAAVAAALALVPAALTRPHPLPARQACLPTRPTRPSRPLVPHSAPLWHRDGANPSPYTLLIPARATP
ncbi:hypothetical protein [Streptomyces flavofungini]|uniref:hypothetical protein n=1 Tax=Streptomyces flavofungini TaxID=68200 RepID=UPI0025B20215|nr:hypothetical protein [Streptomyces flavofungini]WJV47856.1 hypothetical protein QUY26_21465 [Streptomyces flavofungini]